MSQVRRSFAGRLAVALALVVAATGASVSPAWGAFGISAFDGAVLDSQGGAYTQAGGHPDVASASFALNRQTVNGWDYPDGGELKEATVDLPPGFLGNPTAAPTCPKDREIPTEDQARIADGRQSYCPLSSVVGRVVVTALFVGTVSQFAAPVFNLEPPPGVAAQFGFSFANQRTYLDAIVRNDGDYGVRIRARNLNQVVPVLNSTVTLWGVPNDPTHDRHRCFGIPVFPTESLPAPDCDPNSPYPLLQPAASVDPPKAFISLPTRCTPAGVGLETRLSVTSWAPGIPGDQASFISHRPPGYPLPPGDWGEEVGTTGCERVPFEPSFSVKADSAKPDSPTGLAVNLAFPQDAITNPAGLATAHLKRATVALPDGWSVSPSSADGLAGCSDAQSRVGTMLGAECPDASKIGTVEAITPLLEETLTGGVYVGTQKSDDPMSGEMFRLFIALNNEERGIRVKLPGQVRVNPDTGRVETTFDNNPQVPVSAIKLQLKAGPRAPLATPRECGTTTVTADLEAWSGARVTRSSDLTVDCPGGSGFDPSFRAATLGVTAGRFAPFAVRIDRPDGQEFIDGVDVELPEGVLAKLKGVPVCGDAQASAGSCDAGSRVGSATVGAGPGSNPFYISNQPVYLAGPYKGAPYSLSVVTHAKAGPFDLGLVVVRQALHIDRADAHVTVKSDPLPTIVKGVPLRLRSINVDIDRPEFALNPSSCSDKEVDATFHSQQGSIATKSSRFGMHDCGLLRFQPKLALRLTGRKQIRTGRHPGVRAQVTQTGIGEAGISKARVELPRSLALDPDNAQALCEFEDGTRPDLESHCPKGSIVGRARAVTPLLDRPLTGDVYFVKNVRRSSSGNLIRTLPMIVVALRGQIAINLKGESSTTRGGLLVNTFNGVPDAPITRFNLNIRGGSSGILTVTRTRRARINLCSAPKSHIAGVELDGQNARRADYRTRVKTPCAKRAARKGKTRG